MAVPARNCVIQFVAVPATNCVLFHCMHHCVCCTIVLSYMYNVASIKGGHLQVHTVCALQNSASNLVYMFFKYT